MLYLNSQDVQISFKRLTETAKIPQLVIRDLKTGPEIGIDLYADEIIEEQNLVTIKSGVAQSHTGSYWLMLVPRSSTFKRGLMLANSVGIIDPSYRGDIMAVFWIIDPERYKENPPKVGDRLVQLVAFKQVKDFFISEDRDFENTGRGSDGFGSSGR